MAFISRQFIFLSEYKSILILFYLFYLPVQTKSNALYLNVIVDIFSKNTQMSHIIRIISSCSMRARIKTYKQTDRPI